MSGQLSPDGNYYWDGVQWARAVTPDGAWRWDGRAWRPAGGPAAGTSGRTATAIAIGVIAVLLVAGGGIYGVTRVMQNFSKNLQSQISPACTSTGMAGNSVTAFESVCGRSVGTSLYSVDCTRMTSLPNGIVAEQTTTSTNNWTSADVGMDSSGCEMAAQPNMDLGIDSSDVQTPDLVLIADFVPVDVAGSVGLRIGCTSDGSCLDILIDSQETYSLAEGIPNGGWTTLKEGSLALGYMRFNQPNRLILRFAGGDASVFLNGYELARVMPDRAQSDGYFGFYVDDEASSKSVRVQLRQLYVFQAL